MTLNYDWTTWSTDLDWEGENERRKPMTDRMEDTPSFRLGMACTHIRILLGEFGAPQAADLERARAFLKSEDELIHHVLYPETC